MFDSKEFNKSDIRYNRTIYSACDGGITTESVIAFQAAHGLAQDGVIGPATYGAMGFNYSQSDDGNYHVVRDDSFRIYLRRA